jgi:hypothetical protein
MAVVTTASHSRVRMMTLRVWRPGERREKGLAESRAATARSGLDSSLAFVVGAFTSGINGAYIVGAFN